MNPDLDLTLQRVIRAPRSRVWDAWTDPALLASWWTPAPTISVVDRLDVRPGGAFVTRMSEDGVDFVPHTDGVFLVVEPGERLVFTNALTSSWHPATPQPVAMSAEIIFGEHADGTDYRVVVRHGDAAARAHHEELGFFEGWGAVTEALAALAEGDAR
ncbi:SRPBCC domain-containing protein [Agromyces atrinae]|uniref:SRPBCC domain-containing protein n=1 Tax=Agromyces atrinae TaxID=592376 RepID=UPI001F55EA52|nr:SRPBCC domain-containing protein [Agromyces atrinae]MCI2958456.1 SRPBCC domain-containing protein [Agromyces atrinae]